jgi:endoglucanase
MINTFFTKFLSLLLLILLISAGAYPTLAIAAQPVNSWWPTEGARVSGVQPFKAVLQDTPLSSYELYWQVDGGSLNKMNDSYTDAPHKEASVDVSGWNWHGTGPYMLSFVAKQNGATVSQTSVHIYIGSGNASSGGNTPPSGSNPTSTPQPAPTPSPSPASNWYVNPNSSAAKQAASWAASRPQDAAKMRMMASAPTAVWLGGWSGDVAQAASNIVRAAQGKQVLFVAYNIPQRDCGGYSAGGSSNYLSWISSLASGISSAPATVILEPDALSQMTCLSASDQDARVSLLAQAVTMLKKNANTRVYLDAGHAGWIDAGVMASRLKRANLAAANGFALNVSNFDATASETTYGDAISAATNGAHYVIDTSRNGNGSNGQWCNPSGRKIGSLPTTQTNHSAADAYLWIKTPGESDGTCNGGPSAGTWWPDYALGLVP